MIKGVIGYKVLSYKDVEPILMKLRSYAMQFPGFVGAENLVSGGGLFCRNNDKHMGDDGTLEDMGGFKDNERFA